MREAILELAEEQMKAGGYDNLNFGTIAGELSITRANVHHHFKNKEGLANAATQHYTEVTLAWLREIAARHAADFPGFLAELEGYMFMRFRSRGHSGGCVCSQLIRESAVPSSLLFQAQDFFAAKLDLFRGLIVESQQTGAIRPEINPDQLAHLAIRMILGTDQMALASADIETFADQREGDLSSWIALYA